MEEWRKAVASVARKNARAQLRVGELLYEKRGAPAQLTEADMQRLESLMLAVSEWQGYSARDIVEKGVPANTERMLGKQLDIIKKQQPAFLVSVLPADPGRPLAAAPHTHEDAWTFIKDLLTRHRGEAREIVGEWECVHKPFPQHDEHPEFFHAQFCLSDTEAKSMITWSGVGSRSNSYLAGKSSGKGKSRKPASGGKSPQPASGGKCEQGPHDNTIVMRDLADSNVHWLRVARVCGLADLFAQFGSRFHAKDIYEYYISLSIIVHKRERGKSAIERQAAAQQRHRDTGRYGFQ